MTEINWLKLYLIGLWPLALIAVFWTQLWWVAIKLPDRDWVSWWWLYAVALFVNLVAYSIGFWTMRLLA